MNNVQPYQGSPLRAPAAPAATPNTAVQNYLHALAAQGQPAAPAGYSPNPAVRQDVLGGQGQKEGYSGPGTLLQNYVDYYNQPGMRNLGGGVIVGPDGTINFTSLGGQPSGAAFGQAQGQEQQFMQQHPGAEGAGFSQWLAQQGLGNPTNPAPFWGGNEGQAQALTADPSQYWQGGGAPQQLAQQLGGFASSPMQVQDQLGAMGAPPVRYGPYQAGEGTAPGGQPGDVGAYLRALQQAGLGTGNYQEPSAPGETAFMKSVRQQESRNNYNWQTEVNPQSGASGAFQILQSNWPSWAREAGVDPNDHSQEAQNAVAQFKMNQLYQQYGNWNDVAAAWYGGAGGEQAYASGHGGAPQPGGPSINQYVSDVMQNVGAGTVPVSSEQIAAGGPQALAQAGGASVRGLNIEDPGLAAFLQTYLAGVIDPMMAGSQAQIAALQGQIGYAEAGYQNQAQRASQDWWNQQAQLGLTGQGQDIQKSALGRQATELQKQWGLTQQQEQLTAQNLAKQLGFSQQDIESNATARGAIGAPGTAQQLGRAQYAYQSGMQQLGITSQQQQIQAYESIAQNADATRQLDLMSQQLGISKQEVTQRLQATMAQLGIDQYMTIDQLLQEIGQVQQGEYSAIGSMISDIYSLSGLQIPRR